MEENTSLFSLSIDSASKDHLLEAAKWGRFLAIVGFIFLLIMIVAGFYASMTISRYEDMYAGSNSAGVSSILGTTTAITYIVMAIIWFFPLFFLFRFSNAIRTGIYSNDQEKISTAFQNLKVCFRYLGIVTIIGLVMMLLGIILGIAGAALS